jgi:transposase
VTVVGDPAHRRVIGVEDGRDVDAVKRFSNDFEARGGDCTAVTQVSMDMSGAYQSAAALCFPEASVVFDHFHVKKLVLAGMDEARREEQGRSFARNHQAGKKLLMISSSKATDSQQAKQASL